MEGTAQQSKIDTETAQAQAEQQLQKEILLHHKLLGKIQLVRITEMILTLKNLLR
jgi:hypothetical protein